MPDIPEWPLALAAVVMMITFGAVVAWAVLPRVEVEPEAPRPGRRTTVDIYYANWADQPIFEVLVVDMENYEKALQPVAISSPRATVFYDTNGQSWLISHMSQAFCSPAEALTVLSKVADKRLSLARASLEYQEARYEETRQMICKMQSWLSDHNLDAINPYHDTEPGQCQRSE